MQRLVTYQWRTPPPTSVDEELALFDDGSAWLVVRRPREATAELGTYVASTSGEGARRLTARGPGPFVFDLLSVPADGEALVLADQVAAEARAHPRAVVQFLGRPAGPVGGGGSGRFSLVVQGLGTEPVSFELDPANSAIHFSQAGQPAGWQGFPELPMGFMNADAELLGGVRGIAQVAPGALGAIAFEAPVPTGANGVSLQVAGWLHGALPDETLPSSFEVRTSEQLLGP